MESEVVNVKMHIGSLNESFQPNSSVKNVALPVFAAVLKQFLQQLETVDPKITQKVRQSVLAQISLCLSSKEERQRLNAWLRGNVEELEVELNLINMQQSIHHAYIWTSDYFGPVRADELLTSAINKTEGLPIAREFAPANLR